jgi:hypothetical protein
MTSEANGQAGIIRAERGLTITGTRITLYDVMNLNRAVRTSPKSGQEALWAKLQEQKERTETL